MNSPLRSAVRGLAVLALAALPVLASPVAGHGATSSPPSTGTCSEPYVRKEWRRLTEAQRSSYIGAVQCMMKTPANSTLDAVTNRYEDFVATHIVQADEVHFVGIFYPYHRFLLALFEEELWNCGWDRQLGQPYWDWTLDAGSPEAFFGSPLFDNATGFGGNGDWVPGNFTHPAPGMSVGPPWDVPDRTGGGCMASGPFAGLASYLGPGNNTARGAARRCVRRDFSYASLRGRGGAANVTAALDGRLGTFGAFARATEGETLHPAGHWAVGGLYGAMTDKWASPLDPVFWAHHGGVDRAWWSWQRARDPAARLRDVSGPLVAFDYANARAGNATLDTPLWAGLTVRREARVRDVMHIRRGPLCYEYDTLYK